MQQISEMVLLVGARGIEPLTPAMSRQCSTAELSARTKLNVVRGSSNLITPLKPLIFRHQPLPCQGSWHRKTRRQPSTPTSFVLDLRATCSQLRKQHKVQRTLENYLANRLLIFYFCILSL